jgi:hypothetical protein
LRTKPQKWYIWSIPVYSAETGTLWKLDLKYLESFEMWCWRRMKKIRLIDRVKNEEILLRVKEKGAFYVQ